MESRPESDEALTNRMLPRANADRSDRAHAWAEWQAASGEAAVLKFIRANNNTGELDEDILQEALLTAYLEVERGRYEPRAGIPFTAYVKGIARNKIREARRRGRYTTRLDELPALPESAVPRQLETFVEKREARHALLASLAALPGPRRLVLEQYLGGLSTGEIARALRMSEELVRQHKCRGLRSLRRMGFPH